MAVRRLSDKMKRNSQRSYKRNNILALVCVPQKIELAKCFMRAFERRAYIARYCGWYESLQWNQYVRQNTTCNASYHTRHSEKWTGIELTKIALLLLLFYRLLRGLHRFYVANVLSLSHSFSVCHHPGECGVSCTRVFRNTYVITHFMSKNVMRPSIRQRWTCYPQHTQTHNKVQSSYWQKRKTLASAAGKGKKNMLQ